MTTPEPAATWRDRAIGQAGALERSRGRSLATVESIVKAARALVNERRSEPFTTHELVERSGCSLQTIYRYFPSKDAVLLAVFEEIVTEGAALIRGAVEVHEDPVARLRTLIAASIPDRPPPGFDMDASVLVAVHTRLSLLFPAEVERAQQAYVDLVTEIIQALVDGGHAARRAAPADDARLITYLVRATYQALITSRTGDDRTRAAAQVLDFCLGALWVRAT